MLATLVLAVFTLTACGGSEPTLPIFGTRTPVTKLVDGAELVDTIYHSIPDFMLTDQDSMRVSPVSLDGKIYVADFFFVNCPGICPVIKRNMKPVYDAWKDEQGLMFLSHSLDGQKDSIPALKRYAMALGEDKPQVRFVTADELEIYQLAKEYLSSALRDSTAPGGIAHSPWVVLVDTKRRIRGMYDGTQPQRLEQLSKDIPVLLAEEERNGTLKRGWPAIKEIKVYTPPADTAQADTLAPPAVPAAPAPAPGVAPAPGTARPAATPGAAPAPQPAAAPRPATGRTAPGAAPVPKTGTDTKPAVNPSAPVVPKTGTDTKPTVYPAPAPAPRGKTGTNTKPVVADTTKR